MYENWKLMNKWKKSMMNEFHTLWMKRGHSWMNSFINDDVGDDANNDDANDNFHKLLSELS